MNTDDWDFGFTAVNELELEIVQKAEKVAEQSSATVAELELKVKDLESRIQNLYNAMQPFFKNLKDNPEKDYIFWKGVDRVEKIDKFNAHLKSIARLT